MTFAGFFVHLGDIPPVLRWLQWTCPLKFALEALSVNEVTSGLMIVDEIQGVPVNISASIILQLVRRSIPACDDSLKLLLAIWFWSAKLLSRCPGVVCLYCRIWCRCYCRGLVESPRETMNGTFLSVGQRICVCYSSNYIPNLNVRMSDLMSMMHEM